jgi:hypothetical protein
MKHFLTAAVLMLATIAIAQPQTKRLPVMYIGNPDLYLESEHPANDSLPPASATAPQPNMSGKVISRAHGPNPGHDPLPEYLLRTALWSNLHPGEFMEKEEQQETVLSTDPKQMSRKILKARVRKFELED